MPDKDEKPAVSFTKRECEVLHLLLMGNDWAAQEKAEELGWLGGDRIREGVTFEGKMTVLGYYCPWNKAEA